jgi:SAM-dependent methyltransferase
VASEAAIERTLELMAPTARGRARHSEAGYLDVLGEREATGASPGQRLMENNLLVQVYERAWRPLWGRLFLGVLGPDMGGEHRIALELLDLSAGERVLDVGCGPGNFTRVFGRAVEDGLAVGLDASAPMLERAVAEPTPENVVYVRGDASATPFVDGAFDAVCCFAALYLIEEPLEAIDEMVRVLAPGGRLALLSSVNRGLVPTVVANAVVRGLSGVRVFGRGELTGALRERGMADVDQRVSGLGQFVSARKP